VLSFNLNLLLYNAAVGDGVGAVVGVVVAVVLELLLLLSLTIKLKCFVVLIYIESNFLTS